MFFNMIIPRYETEFFLKIINILYLLKNEMSYERSEVYVPVKIITCDFEKPIIMLIVK